MLTAGDAFTLHLAADGPYGAASSDVTVAAGDVPAAPTNVACAVAVARELGVPDDVIARRIPTLPVAPNRLTVSTGSTGFAIVDDRWSAPSWDALGHRADDPRSCQREDRSPSPMNPRTAEPS